MASSRERDDRDDDIPLHYIVFSCGTCQATIPDVYAERQSNQGFHSGSGDDDGIVTKLWIAECSHIICGKHLAGGAAPFHPKGEQPRAPCPQCQEKGDDTPRELYGIRGLDDGECDAAIPKSWMNCPAIKLDGSVPGMEALRFQYLNMARYAQRVTRYWKLAVRNRHAMECAHADERKQRRKAQQEVLELKSRVEDLEQAEAKLQKWESKKPVINHYLGMVSEMAMDIETMRNQLAQLGYTAPKRSYSFEPDEKAQRQDAAAMIRPGKEQHPSKSFSSSSTVVALDHNNFSSSRKRKLSEYAPETERHADVQRPQPRGSSRDLMPPPLPKARPSQSNGFAHAETPPTHFRRRPPSPRQSVQVYKDQSWKASQERPRESTYRHSPSAGPYALPHRPSSSQRRPIDDARQSARPSYRDDVYDGPLSPVDISSLMRSRQPLEHSDVPNAARRPGPIYRPVDERREVPPPRQSITNRPSPRIQHYDADYGTATQRREGQTRPPLQLYSESQLNQQLARSTRVRGTPSPPRQKQPPDASITSPFFKRGAASRPIAQRPPARGSFVRSLESQAHDVSAGYQMTPRQLDSSYGYVQRRPIDSLSFIEKPHGASDRQPLGQSPTFRPETNNRYPQEYAIPQTPRNSQGLLRRPDRPPPSATYAASRLQSNVQRTGRVSLPPNQHRGPPAGSQEHALSQISGVRGVSSQGVRPRQYPNGSLYDAPRTLFSSAGGRRSVRR